MPATFACSAPVPLSLGDCTPSFPSMFLIHVVQVGPALPLGSKKWPRGPSLSARLLHPLSHRNWLGRGHATRVGQLLTLLCAFEGKKCSLFMTVAELVGCKPGPAGGHPCHHWGRSRPSTKATERMKRDQERRKDGL